MKKGLGLRRIKYGQWLLLLLVGGLLLLLPGCGAKAPPEENGEDIALLPPEGPEPVYGPLNHALLDEEAQAQVLKRPLVVTIDNLSRARPQSGLNKADLLYELPAEGGISRFLAIFYCGSSEVVGPIRSARPYLVDVAKEYGGMYIHVGGSQDALNYLATGGWPYLNEFSSGKYFWRDKKRRAPHNLYTSTENLAKAMADKGWDEEIVPRAFLFLEEGERIVGTEKADIVRINYIHARNTYTYDQENGFYWRQINNNPHVDAESDEQLTAVNIIVQKVSSRVLDREGRLAINMVGEGEALLFSQGLVKKGVWKRPSLGEPTIFGDENGLEWKLAPGTTWIQVTDQTVKTSYEDTTTPSDS